MGARQVLIIVKTPQVFSGFRISFFSFMFACLFLLVLSSVS